MEWARTPKTTRDEGSGSERRDPIRVLWAENAFRSMASPIYQSKLLRRMVTLPGSKSESAGNPESSSAEPRPIRSSGSVSGKKLRPDPPCNGETYKEPHQNESKSRYARRAHFELEEPLEVPRNQRRRVRSAQPPPSLVRSGETSSYESFSGTGRESVRLSKQNLRESVSRDNRRYSPRPKSRPRAAVVEMESSQEEKRPNPRRVSFAKR